MNEWRRETQEHVISVPLGAPMSMVARADASFLCNLYAPSKDSRPFHWFDFVQSTATMSSEDSKPACSRAVVTASTDWNLSAIVNSRLMSVSPDLWRNVLVPTPK